MLCFQCNHHVVQSLLVDRILAQQCVADGAVDVGDCLQHAFAHVTALVAVAQFQGFTRSRGGTRGRAGATDDAIVEQDVSFDGRVAARIKHFTTFDVDDFCHCYEHSEV
jgi:hypothetical protein